MKWLIVLFKSLRKCIRRNKGNFTFLNVSKKIIQYFPRKRLKKIYFEFQIN